MQNLKETISPMSDYFYAVNLTVKLKNILEVKELIEEIDNLLMNKGIQYLVLTETYKMTFQSLMEMVETSYTLIKEESNEGAYRELFLNSVLSITERLCDLVDQLMAAEFQLKQLTISNISKIVISNRVKYLI
ncbi:hypothetical protein [Alkalihalobacterium elongatum]|uniref:hypothetical protein n=1 Tax=Alkalihalobacterium elongatum TaxID=2675466 RepID=UPI001C200E19|nr:hypothetical protein [Alkalihalobacterium elongatum]